ncbi:protein translocase subunit SecD [Oceanibacterium hippocampi]|uniref:Multifunctional fusion protein n=1 Tax=Oceanibacterium hippocampi TaxID=745714 RepID=A0A1Y5T4U7_9PROT|nr:protein translocase subunit SecD [Oceanibacterium hippocampi]SLN55915.1 Multidrug resistance protein MdtC [Oceanibacterium hippocampi]
MLFFPKWKTALVLGVCLLGLLFSAPNLLTREQASVLPDWLPHKQLNLGLDLRGGSHLLLQVGTEAVLKEQLEALEDRVRDELRDDPKIGYTGLGNDGTTVHLTIRDSAQVDMAYERLRGLAAPINGNLFGGGGGRDIDVSQDGDTIRLDFTEAALSLRLKSAVEQSIEVVRKRVNELGVSEPSIQRQGADRILVQVPGYDDPAQLKNVIGKTAKMNFRLVDTNADPTAARAPAGSEILPSEDPDNPRPYVIKKRIMVPGDNLIDAQPTFRDGQAVVTIRFDSAGAKRFANTTAENVGRPFAIVLDGKVISAPVIREPILGGSAEISGSFTVASANELALLLRSGALPAPLTILEERSVGPDLGADSIDAGIIASILAIAIVMVFMFMAYGLFGLAANVALLVNLLVLAGALSLLQATLTLPGIAGIILTIGMAVDANVLIFERIREESRAGKSPLNAIESGYRQAFTTIIDANVTTMIAALILFTMGSGPVRGFAVTLGIGVASSMFTAILLTRLILATWIRRKRPKVLPEWKLRLVPKSTTVPFIKMRLVAFALSIALGIGSMAMFAGPGLNRGIDFEGGILMEVGFPEAADLSVMRSTLGGLGLGDVALQNFGADDDILIRVERQPGGDDAQNIAVTQVKDSLEANFGTDLSYRRIEFVGPTVSEELIWTAIEAVAVAIAAMLIYIWFRFEWQFSVGAVIAIVHDVILTIGMFSITGLEFNLASVAAILTIVGYSINDTVVVYDRIRENLRKYKTMGIADLLDQSINETLSRTTLTSFTTLLALFALYFFGGEVIRGFAAAMIWGIFVGTYSSIFVASPLLMVFGVDRKRLEDDEDAAGKASSKA